MITTRPRRLERSGRSPSHPVACAKGSQLARPPSAAPADCAKSAVPRIRRGPIGRMTTIISSLGSASMQEAYAHLEAH